MIIERRWGAVVVAIVWGMAATVLAQDAAESSDAEARALFNAGQVAYEDARFEDALAYFERAHDLSGRPALLFNIASAAERVRDDQRALKAYQQYLDALPEAPNRRFVEGRIRFLEEAMASREARDTESTETATDVPSPQDAARQTPATAASPGAPEPPEDSGGSVLGQWWFWTVVGAVIVAGVATGVVLGTRDGGGTQEPLAGDVGPGGVVVTLGGGGP